MLIGLHFEQPRKKLEFLERCRRMRCCLCYIQISIYAIDRSYFTFARREQIKMTPGWHPGSDSFLATAV